MKATQPKRMRINITPSPEVWALVNTVHDLTGEAKAAIISGILDEIAPAFQTTIQALHLAKSAPREAQQLMSNFGARAVGELMQAQLELDEAIDGRTVKGKRKRRAGGRAAQ
jgi:hypothetical protein